MHCLGLADSARVVTPQSGSPNADDDVAAGRQREAAAGAALTSAGLLVVNPPWTLAGELRTILPELEKPLGQGGAGRFRLETPKPSETSKS